MKTKCSQCQLTNLVNVFGQQVLLFLSSFPAMVLSTLLKWPHQNNVLLETIKVFVVCFLKG